MCLVKYNHVLQSLVFLMVYEIKIFIYPRDKNCLTYVHICFLIHHSLTILITSRRNASIIVFPLAWVARPERHTGTGRVDLWFTSRHIKKHILQVRRAERLGLRPPCSAPLRFGPAWRGRALETDGAGTQKLRLLHPVASAPPEYPIASRCCTWLDRMFDIVWPTRRAPIVPGADHANRLARRTHK